MKKICEKSDLSLRSTKLNRLYLNECFGGIKTGPPSISIFLYCRGHFPMVKWNYWGFLVQDRDKK